MRSEVSMLTSSALGVGSGAIGGGMAAFGAYSGTMMLASGGFGMAGGAVGLGTLAAGPALLIFGSVLGAKAESKLNDARGNLKKVRAFEAKSEAVITKLEGISEVANLATDTLSKLRTQCRRSCKAMANIITSKGVDYSTFSNEEQAVVFRTVKLAQLIKVIVDTAILDEEGNLLNDASSNINKAYGSCNELV